jgi:hypothetical protein
VVTGVTGTFPPLPGFPGDAATRCLCHAIHEDDDLRDYVLHTVVDPHLKATCPAYGVDLVAAGRHAALARRRLANQQAAFWLVRVILVLAVAAGVVLRSVTAGAVIFCAALVAAWCVLFQQLRAARISALKAVTDPAPPEDQAGPLPPEVEERLGKLSKANAVIYARGEGDPFIGSGRRLHWFQFNPIDVTRAGQDSAGSKRTLRAFTAVELHHYLATQVPKLGFDGLRVRNRLYVRGDYVPHVPGLLPDSYAAPEPVVRSDWVKSGVEHPTERARTYICMERIMSGGELVVSMYVRAWLEQNLLSIERIIYFLPPLQERFRPERELIAGGAAGATVRAFATAARRTLPVLAGARVSRRRPGSAAVVSRRAEAKARREIKAGFPYDYGARTSLREAAAAYDTKEHFAEADVLDSAKRLGRRLMDCIEKFLDDRGVDTSEFHDQVQFINNTVSNIGSIQAANAVVGGQGNIIAGHGAVNNFGPGPAAAPQGAQQMGGGA